MLLFVSRAEAGLLRVIQLTATESLSSGEWSDLLIAQSSYRSPDNYNALMFPATAALIIVADRFVHWSL